MRRRTQSMRIASRGRDDDGPRRSGGLAAAEASGARTRRSLAVAATLAFAAVATALPRIAPAQTPASLAPVVAWRSDCAPPPRLAPLGLDAARDAFRRAGLRHENRLREAAEPGFLLRKVASRFAVAPSVGARPPGQPEAACPRDVADLGEELFEHEFGYADGIGGGDAIRSDAGPFRRVHAGLFGGPETISCPSCHWVGGPNGAGAETDNAFLAGDGMAPGAGDARNAPALVGGGVVEALAREMTAELHAQRDELLGRRGAGERRLVAKGVDFGVLRVDAGGRLDASALDGIDADLVVRPFGWKGVRPDLASFAAEALQVHLGIQSDALLAGEPVELRGRGADALDPDGDGVRNELGRAALAAMTLHLALAEMPVVEPLVQDLALAPAATGLLAPTTTSFVDDFARGRQRFHELGCAGCHRPMLLLKSPVLGIDGLPPVDLAREMRSPALRYDEALGGYPVWLFSDLKRHDMGAANESRHEQRGVARREYLTPRLWGAADSAPYLHDGRAPSFDYAIAGHDGEGAEARAKYAALTHEEKGDLRVYLMSLRRASRVVVP